MLLRPSRSIYLPHPVIRVIQETGAHPICVMGRLIRFSLKGVEIKDKEIRLAVEECIRENKYVAVHKFLRTPPSR